jgi:glutamine amidotransferase
MCRWITLLSTESFSLSDIVLSPSNSMVQMSIDASFHPGYGDINNHVMNGDGFGVGWYHNNYFVDKHASSSKHPMNGTTVVTTTNGSSSTNNNGNNPNPNTTDETNDTCKKHGQRLAAVFKDILPAWNNINLKEICQAAHSDCMMAHVRAASKGSGVSQQNCHPFKAGRLMFCHNGRIDSFTLLRRRYHALLSDEAYLGIRGSTDSEFIFALILTILSNDGKSDVLPMEQTKPFEHNRLVGALKKVLRMIDDVQVQAGLDNGFNTCNFALTDGETMVVTRYCDKSPTIPAPSLYFAYGYADDLYHEITEEEPHVPIHSTHPSAVDVTHSYGKQHSSNGSNNGDADNSTVHTNSSEEEDTEDMEPVKLKYALSTPGRIFGDIDPKKACLVVCSTPLTRTHSWHRIPANAILYYKRGCFPELRLLKTRDQTLSFISIN